MSLVRYRRTHFSGGIIPLCNVRLIIIDSSPADFIPLTRGIQSRPACSPCASPPGWFAHLVQSDGLQRQIIPIVEACQNLLRVAGHRVYLAPFRHLSEIKAPIKHPSGTPRGGLEKCDRCLERCCVYLIGALKGAARGENR